MEQRQYEFLMARMDKQDDRLEKILVQATKTNGRVDRMERDLRDAEESIDGLNDTKNFIKGRDKTLYIILGAGGALALMFLEHLFFK